MKFYIIEPEVSGGIGENTVMDKSTHLTVVRKLHYEFDGWLGDCVIEGFPYCYIITKDIQKQLIIWRVTGVNFDEVEISTSELFLELYPNRKLPEFIWLKVHGVAGKDDFGFTSDRKLVVSENVLNLFRSHSLLQAIVTEWSKK